jgi:hypothetical protein
MELPDKWEGPRAHSKDFGVYVDQTRKSAFSHAPSQTTHTGRSLQDEQSQFLSDNTVQEPFEPIEIDNDADDPAVWPPPVFSMPPEATTDVAGAHEPEDRIASPTDADNSVPALFVSVQSSAKSVNSNSPAGIPVTPEKSTSGLRFVPHDRSLSPMRVSPMGHVDWNFPPAFPSGVPVSPSKAHMPSIAEPIQISDDEDEDDEVSVSTNGKDNEGGSDDKDDDTSASIAPKSSDPSQIDSVHEAGETTSANSHLPSIQLGSNDLDIFSNNSQ